MRSFSKKLAFVLAAAMVVTGFAPAAQAKAAEDFSLNRTSYILYTNEDSINMKGSKDLADGLTGNVTSYDFNLANKPADWKTAYSYKWASSKADVATVVTGGVVTAKSVGYTDITCTITEKATGNVAATLTAKVQVKANADKVEIYAADGTDYDGVKVAPGTEIDFNRNMFDEAGNKTNKKGTYVTDNTRWVVSPANKGVTVNQDNGVVTVADDAKGEFTVYAETYQSDKYNKATATSNKVVFTVGDDSFEVEQDTVTKFTVKFDNKVASVGDVTVNRLYKGFEIPVLVKKAELAKDGMSATVELYSALKNNEEYAINIPGYDVYKLTASAGDPVEVLIYVDDKFVEDAFELVYINGTAVTLKYRLIDAKGVDVTDVAGGVVLFNAKDYSTDGSYYVSADQMWFAKEDVEVTVTADYQSGRYENGVQVAPAKGEKVFYSAKKEATQVLGLADWKIAGKDDWSDKKQSVPFGDPETPAVLAVKVKLTEGDPVVAGAGDPVLNGYISFQELNPEVAALNESKIVFFKQGVARILVYFNYQDGNGNLVEIPIAEVKPEATAPKTLQSMDIDKKMITLGTVDGYDEATITVSAKNNYNEKYDVTGKVTIESVDNNSKAALKADAYAIVGDKITLYGYELQQNTPNKPATVQLTFKVKVNDGAGKVLEQTVTVLLKSRGAEGTEYIQIAAEGFGGNIARTVSSKNAKTGSFTVYKYSNGVQVGTQELLPYDANNVSANAYYFKVTKGGTDVTNKVASYANGKVTINFSKVENDVVKYTDFGAGNYVFTLYKGVAVGANTIAVQQSSAAGSVTCNVGAYSNAVRVKDNLAGDTSDAAIRAAFTIKDTKGQDAGVAFSVDADRTSDNYVYVKSITFRDPLDDGSFAEYTVNVGVALLKNAQ